MQTSLNLNIEIQKVNDISNKNANSKENSKAVDKDNKFSDYLQKEKNVKETTSKDIENKNTETISENSEESIANNEVEEKKEIDKKVEDLSKDDILACLQALVNALNKANTSADNNMAISGKVDLINKLNSQISDSIMKVLDLKDNLNQNILGSVTNITANINNTSNANLDPASLMNNLLELLNSADASALLDKKSLTIAESLLNQLGLKLDNANKTNNINVDNINSNVAIDNKSFIQDLISEAKDKINALKDSYANKEILNFNSMNKLIVPKEDIKTNAEEGKNAFSDKMNTMASEVTTNGKTSDSNGYESKKDSNSSFSKEDKILKSILGEDSKETPKLSMFTTNTVSNGNAEAIKAAQVVNKETMATDMIKSVKYMTSNNLKEMVVKVNPGNLGEITIKLIEEDGNMKLNIKASAKETYSLLSQQAAEIKSHLSNQNIKIQEVNIGVYDDDTTFFKDGQFQNNFSQGENRKENAQTSTTRESYIEDEPSENEIDEISNINMLA